MKREFIGQGREHTVVRAIFHPGWVLKTPSRATIKSLERRGVGPLDLKYEIDEATQLTSNSTVQVPETRIFAFSNWQRGYIMAQRYIEEDGSITHIRNHLKRTGVGLMVAEYYINPDNFISNQGIVYWVDPLKGPIGRLVEKSFISKIISYNNLRSINAL